jgi:hypothetical protein
MEEDYVGEFWPCQKICTSPNLCVKTLLILQFYCESLLSLISGAHEGTWHIFCSLWLHHSYLHIWVLFAKSTNWRLPMLLQQKNRKVMMFLLLLLLLLLLSSSSLSSSPPHHHFHNFIIIVNNFIPHYKFDWFQGVIFSKCLEVNTCIYKQSRRCWSWPVRSI